MKIDVATPQILDIEGIGRRAHVRLRGEEASVAIEARDIITTQRLRGRTFSMLESRWLITATTNTPAGVGFTCRRLSDA
jgi:hypothetical protein